MNVQNILYVLAVGAFAIASYYAIEMRVINIDQEISENELLISPAVSLGNDLVFEEETTEQTDDSLPVNGTEIEAREEEAAVSATDAVSSSFDYNDGDYTVSTSYALPNGGSHDMEVSFTFREDTITGVSVVFDGSVGKNTTPQKRFIDTMNPLVIGNDIDSISLSRVGGSSLTTNGFNDALEKAKTMARA